MKKLDYFETLIHEQACDELEWTIEDAPYLILFASPVYRRVCMELLDDVFCRLTGNLDADL